MLLDQWLSLFMLRLEVLPISTYSEMDLRKLMLMLNSEPVLLTLERPVSASITDNLVTLASKSMAES